MPPVPPDDVPLASIASPGARVGNYVLERLLGRGAFGEVWLAVHHERPGRSYALKLALDPRLRAQLATEGRFPDIRHPHLVEVIDSNTSADPPYIVMEFAPGGTLAEELRRHPAGLPPDRARALAVGIAEALAALHAAGVVHRDLKPGNVLLDAEGRAMVGDYGLSLVTEEGDRRELSFLDSRMLSRDGDDPGGGGVAGTPAYLAPEVREGHPATAAADIYAWGLILFEMLAGRRPAGAELPSTVCRDLPNGAVWDALYYWATVSAGERYADGAALVAALRGAPRPLPFATADAGDRPRLPEPKPLPDDLSAALWQRREELRDLLVRHSTLEKEIGTLLDTHHEHHATVRQRRFEQEGLRHATDEARRRLADVAGALLAPLQSRLATLAEHRVALQVEGLRPNHPQVMNLDAEVAALETLVEQVAEWVARDGYAAAAEKGGNAFHRQLAALIALPDDASAARLDALLREFGDGPGNPWAGELRARRDRRREEERRAERARRQRRRVVGALWVTALVAIFALAGRAGHAWYQERAAERRAAETRAAEERRLAQARAAEERRLAEARAAEERRQLSGPGRQAGERRVLAVAPGVEMAFRWIPPGTFTMGSPSSESGRDSDEGPQTRVTLTSGFWMGETEVTQRQYEAIAGTNPSHFKGADLPVEQVSWNDATEFCRRLSERARLRVRLPTEAEWEVACRAGTTTRWHFGDAEFQLGNYAWFGGNAGGRTHPVGTKQPNAWGLHDMHGNVWEWCSDWYAAQLPGGSVTNHSGPSSGTYRVIRGGSWNYNPAWVRSASRSSYAPDLRLHLLGFRVVVSPTPGS